MACIVTYYDVVDKSPGDKVAVSLDWSDVLATGETIALSTWTAEDGVTLSGDVIVDNITTTDVEGGTCANAYDLTNQITTSAGYIYQRTQLVAVGVS